LEAVQEQRISDDFLHIILTILNMGLFLCFRLFLWMNQPLQCVETFAEGLIRNFYHHV